MQMKQGIEDRPSCYSHVVRKVAEMGFELPEEYAAAACSPEKWACELRPGVDPVMGGDVVEMMGDGGSRHVGVMIDRVVLEHVDVRRGGVLQRVPLSAVIKAGVLVRIMRPVRRNGEPRVTRNQDRIALVVDLYDDAVSKAGHRRVVNEQGVSPDATLDALVTWAMIAAGKRGPGWKYPVVGVDGKAVKWDECVGARVGPRASSLHLIVCPAAPGDASTIILAVIAIAASAASYALTPRIRAPRADNPSDGDRRLGFVRYSRRAVRGEPIPVVFGEHLRYGPVKVVAVPEGGDDGDSLLRLLFVLGEGPFERIGTRTFAQGGGGNFTAPAFGGVYLNDQPLANFPGVRCAVRFGQPGQRPIAGFVRSQVPREVAAGSGGQALRNTSGSERTGGDTAEAVTYTTVDAVDNLVLRVRFPRGLVTFSSGGDPVPRVAKFRYRTRLWTSGGTGTWSAWTVKTVEKAVQTELGVSVRLDDLTTGTNPPARFDVQVQRVSVESSSTTVVDEMRLAEVIEEIEDRNTYEGCALLALTIPVSDEFSSEPRVSVDVRGYRGLRVWDGVSDVSSPVFATGYSNHPADIALAIATDSVVGMGGQWGDSKTDVAGLLENKLLGGSYSYVNQGTGQVESKPFACNLVVLDSESAIDVLRKVAAAMRMVPVLADKLRFIQDRPRDLAVETFTDGDIVRGDDGASTFGAAYELTKGGTHKPNQLVAQFVNERLDGNTDTLKFPEAGDLWLGGASPEPVNTQTVRMDGLTDPDQVRAELVYRMKRQRAEDAAYTFEVARDFVVCQPWERIDVAAGVPGWGVSGRCLSGCATTVVRVDREIVVVAGERKALRVVHLDDSVEVGELALAPGVYAPGTVLPLTAALSQAPAEGAVFAVGAPGREVQALKVTQVAPAESNGWRITAVPYVPDVFVPEAGDVGPVSVTSLGAERSAPGPVINLRLIERSPSGETTGGVVRLQWDQTPQDRLHTASFRVYKRTAGGGGTSWRLLPGVSAGLEGVDLSIVDPNVSWEFVVVAVSPLGVAMAPDDPRHTRLAYAVGLGLPPVVPPATVIALQVGGAGNRFQIAWDGVFGATAYQLLGCSLATGNPNGGAEDAIEIARVGVNGAGPFILPPGRAARFYVRCFGPGAAGGRPSIYVRGLDIAGTSVPAPVGQAVKHTYAANLTAGGGGTFTNSAWDAGQSRLEIANAASNGGRGVWVSPVVDTGSLTLTELTIDPKCANDAELAAINSGIYDLMAVPSIEAEQWGTVSGSGAGVQVGMLMPPWPMDLHGYLFEIQTSADNVVWGAWQAISYGQAISATLRYYRVRVTLSRKTQGTPYRAALKSLAVVGTH